MHHRPRTKPRVDKGGSLMPTTHRSPAPGGMSRRGLLASGGALGLGALLTACGSDEKSGEAGARAPRAALDLQGRPRQDRQGGPQPRRTSSPSSARPPPCTTTASTCTGDLRPHQADGRQAQPAGGRSGRRRTDQPRPSPGASSTSRSTRPSQPDLLISNMFPPPALWFVPADRRQEDRGARAHRRHQRRPRLPARTARALRRTRRVPRRRTSRREEGRRRQGPLRQGRRRRCARPPRPTAA